MIQAWRLCRRPFTDLSGEGAARFGGRWNRRGRPVVYLAEHPALAVLEVRVHLDLPLDLLPDDYVLVEALIPEAAAVTIAETPADTAARGDAWLAAGKTAMLRVPSVLVPHAWNILLNPAHPGSAEARIGMIEPFRFDPRMWHSG